MTRKPIAPQRISAIRAQLAWLLRYAGGDRHIIGAVMRWSPEETRKYTAKAIRKFGNPQS